MFYELVCIDFWLSNDYLNFTRFSWDVSVLLAEASCAIKLTIDKILQVTSYKLLMLPGILA